VEIMLDKKVPTFAGEASWNTADRNGPVHVVCKMRSPDNIALEFTWNQWKYEAWLDHCDGEAYVGAYKLRKATDLVRGRATCFLKPVEGGVDVRGIFDEDCRDYEWHARMTVAEPGPSQLAQ
jgi:hypothetical protein